MDSSRDGIDPIQSTGKLPYMLSMEVMQQRWRGAATERYRGAGDQEKKTVRERRTDRSIYTYGRNSGEGRAMLIPDGERERAALVGMEP